LNLLKTGIYLFPEVNLIELIKQCLVEPLRDPVCLWMSDFGPAMLNVIQVKIELIRMVLTYPTILGTTICQGPE
jgi:hypothetical protein